jgi:CO dehydrogenase maturation factor
MNVLLENKEFGFISMGQGSGQGCFCPVNNLLRRTLKSAVARFNPVIIDAEAGVEQVNRMVVENIDHAFLITDISKRGVDTCLTINETISQFESMRNCTRSVIFNKTDEIPALHREALAAHGITIAGAVGSDRNLIDADMNGTPLLCIPTDSPAVLAIDRILSQVIASRNLQ